MNHINIKIDSIKSEHFIRKLLIFIPAATFIVAYFLRRSISIEHSWENKDSVMISSTAFGLVSKNQHLWIALSISFFFSALALIYVCYGQIKKSRYVKLSNVLTMGAVIFIVLIGASVFLFGLLPNQDHSSFTNVYEYLSKKFEISTNDQIKYNFMNNIIYLYYAIGLISLSFLSIAAYSLTNIPNSDKIRAQNIRENIVTLKHMLYIGATCLVLLYLSIDFYLNTFSSIAQSIVVEDGNGNIISYSKNIKESIIHLFNGYTAFWGIILTLVLILTFLPSYYFLSTAAVAYANEKAQVESTEDNDRTPEEIMRLEGFNLSFGSMASTGVAMLSPILTGTISELLKSSLS